MENREKNDMKTIDYRLIPKTFVHCSNSGCTRAAYCLRQVAFRNVDESRRTVSVLNPRLAQGEDCTEYLTSELQLFKRGLTHLFDNIPMKAAREIRDTLYYHFGNTQYYRIVNGERAISPREQVYIERVLQANGVSGLEAYDAEEYRFFV